MKDAEYRWMRRKVKAGDYVKSLVSGRTGWVRSRDPYGAVHVLFRGYIDTAYMVMPERDLRVAVTP